MVCMRACSKAPPFQSLFPESRSGSKRRKLLTFTLPKAGREPVAAVWAACQIARIWHQAWGMPSARGNALCREQHFVHCFLLENRL